MSHDSCNELCGDSRFIFNCLYFIKTKVINQGNECLLNLKWVAGWGAILLYVLAVRQIIFIVKPEVFPHQNLNKSEENTGKIKENNKSLTELYDMCKDHMRGLLPVLNIVCILLS